MKKQQEKQIVDLDRFDSEVSLYQLLPSGAGRASKRLKTIINSIHNGQVQQSKKPFSLLIAGSQGTRTHARSFLRALGLEYINESPSNLLQSPITEIYSFFNPTRLCDSYIISAVSLLVPSALKIPYEIITKGQFTVYNYLKKADEIVPVFKPVILTTHTKNKVPSYFQEKIDHIVELEEYTDQQLELIVLQRLKYCMVDYAEEKVLWLIVEYGLKKLHDIIRILKSAITVMLSDSRNILTVEDVKTVMGDS